MRCSMIFMHSSVLFVWKSKVRFLIPRSSQCFISSATVWVESIRAALERILELVSIPISVKCSVLFNEIAISSRLRSYSSHCWSMKGSIFSIWSGRSLVGCHVLPYFTVLLTALFVWPPIQMGIPLGFWTGFGKNAILEKMRRREYKNDIGKYQNSPQKEEGEKEKRTW